MQRVSESEGLNQDNIRQHAEEGITNDANLSWRRFGYIRYALEFLCLAEGGEVTHYEVLSEVAKELKEKKFATEVRSILKKKKNTSSYAHNLQEKIV